MSRFKTSRGRIRSVAPAAAGAVALLAASPSALADGETFEFRVSNVLSPAQPTATVELWAHFDPADDAFAHARLDIHAGEEGWVPGTPIELWHGTGIGTSPGEISGSAIVGIFAAQLNLGSTLLPDTSNPIWIWEAEFSVSDFHPRSIALDTVTVDFAVFPNLSSPATESRISTFTEGAGEILVIPASGASMMLALPLCLAANRRRRR